MISGGTAAPVAQGGFVSFNGAGTGTGVLTANIGVVINANTRFTTTYTINPDCTGTAVSNVAGSISHCNVYVDPFGKSASFVGTDPGIVSAATATRVAP